MGRQVLAATVVYRDWLQGPVVAAGDFNHNVCWDRPRGKRNHRDTIDALEAIGCTSAYHRHHGYEQGQEPDATLYLLHNVDKGSHVDYVFVPTTWRILEVTVGTFEDWRGISDHRPVTVDVKPA